MSTKEDIESMKKKLEKAINKEFVDSLDAWKTNIRNFLEKGEYMEVVGILNDARRDQNIEPSILLEKIALLPVEEIIKYIEGRQAKKKRIYKIIMICQSIKSLNRK